MREGVVSDLIARNDLFHLEGEPIRREDEQLDTLFISETDGVTEVFAAKGKGVIYVSYYGYADMDVLLKNVSEKIDLISE